MPRLSDNDRAAALADLDGWSAVDGREAIEKRYTFKDFVEAFGFMTRCAILSEKADHHPEWSNVYKTVEVVLTTHDEGGVTEKDIALAQAFDAAA
ncbi:MAG: 4a-hydroxytetrahydrobiopterin dehydratase [Pseudomonadota bacterium]